MVIRTSVLIRRLPISVRTTRRNYGSLYPYKKLRAFPFALPPEKAKLQMGVLAQKYCGEQRFDPVVAQLMWDLFDRQPKSPVTFSAIYLPFWIISCRGYFRWMHMGDDEVPKGKLGAFNCNFPFFPVPGTHAPLFPTAYQFYHWDILRKDNFLPRPFTESFLQEQERSIERQVTCLPYTISPLALLKSIQSSPGRTVNIGGHSVQVQQASISNFSPMPVLLPMYVAKYQDKDGDDLIMFIDAFVRKPIPKADRRQLIHLSEKHGVPLDNRLLRLMKDVDTWDFSGFHSRADSVGVDSFTHLTVKVGGREPTDRFLDDMLGTAENLSQLASLGSLASDSDDRIVEMTESEIKTRWENYNAWVNKRKEMIKSSKKKPLEKDKVGIWSKYSSLSKSAKPK